MIIVKVISNIGYLLIGLDVIWLTWWVTVAAREPTSPGYGSLGLTALSSPHTALIPLCISHLFDIQKHCRNGVCSLETPRYMWYIAPLLAIPFDILELRLNTRTGTPEIVNVTYFTVFMSLAISAWSYAVYIIIRQTGHRREEPAELVEHKMYL
jgi:hypothetical protein